MKFKQLLSVVLMLCMVASSMVAFAAPSYDASYNCSSISFGYEDGEVWTDASSLEGGQTITGKVTVSTTGEEENMVFSMFVYKNGKMIDGEICTLPVGSTAVEFKASADIPAEAEGCQLVAVLWNNFYDMKMICDAALFPGTNTKLRALYLDGVKLEGFDPDVTEYTYAIEPNAEKYPEITWETVDSAVKATYIAPKSFPGIAVVSVEGGNGEKTEYRVKYDTTVGDYISNVGGLATNPVYVKGGFKVGGTAYNDRSYYVTAINAPEYEGADMIQASIGWQTDAVFNGSETVDWITFDTARGVTVKVLKSDIGATAHFVEEGWTMEQTTVEGGFVQTTTNTVKNHNVAMSKHFNPGKVVIPNGKSGTTYLVAIILDPIGYVPEGGEDEPEVVVDETLDLASLLVDGVALEGFDAQTLTYNYSLIAEQAANVTAPVVTCTLADETSTVEIKAPKTFPGNATITVTNAKGNSRVYTIKYISEKVSGLALNETLPENTPVAAFAENFQAGATVFADRGTTFFATEINDAFAIGKDRIQLCAGWRFDEKPYVDIYKGATLIKDWLSFTVARDTIVTIYEDADNDSFYTGYEKETATDSAYIVAPYGTSPLKYDVKYSKVYKAGTKVEIPNANKSQRTGMIVLTYAPWGEEFDEGQVPDVPVVPDEPEDHALCLADLKIDGETVNGFAEDVFTFTHTLTSAQLTATDAPAITYTLADATSSAVVTKPDTFPGSAKITVTSKAGDSRTYTVNYAAELVADLATDVEGKNPVYVAGGIKTNGNVASDRIGTAETTWRILSYSEALAGNDTVLSNVEGWVGDVTEVKFTLARKAKVKVLLNDHAGAAASNLNKYTAVGFTADPDTTNEKITIIRKPPNAAEDIRPYAFMGTKVFEAGEVSVPYTKPNMPVVIAIEYLPWGGEFTEPVVPDEPDTPVVPDEPENALEIMSVKDGKESIVVFVHDDGNYPTAEYLNEQFARHNLKGSVGFIAKNINDTNKQQWQELLSKGYLNAESHSMTHTYMGQNNEEETAIVNGEEMQIPAGKITDEIVNSRTYLQNIFNDNKLYVYIRPGVGTITDLAGNKLTSTSDMAMGIMKNTYLAARVTGRTAFTKDGVDTIPPTDYYGMYSIMPTNDTTCEDMMASVDEAVAENGILVFCFHMIEDTVTNKNSTRKSETNQLFDTVGDYVAENKVWNPFYYEAVLYMKEAEAAVATLESEGDVIEVNVTDGLDNAIFNYPLTVKVPVPAQWEKAQLTQEDRAISYIDVIHEGDEAFVYANIVPDEGIARINEASRSGHYATLSDLKVDGNTVKGFEPTRFNYTVELDASVTNFPEITYTTIEGGEAVVANPETFPGEATVTVTEEGMTNVYTITYAIPSVITDLKVADESTTAPVYVENGIGVGKKAYSDRSYTFTNVSAEGFDGKNVILASIEWQSNATFKSATCTDWLTFNSARKVKVTVLKSTTSGQTGLIERGFEYSLSADEKGYVQTRTTDDKNFKYAYTKTFEAGEVVIPNAMTGSAYLVVLEFEGWKEGTDTPVVPDEPAEDALVNSISIDGKEIAGFDEETYEYTVTLSKDQIAADSYPEVTYDVAEGADASVTNPVSFPGFAEIKVTKGAEEKTYKVTYHVPAFSVNLSSEAPQGTPGVSVVKGVNVGDKNFQDRTTFPIEAINDDTITADTLKIKTCVGWQTDQKDYATLYKSSSINDWLSFTAPRAMVVTVYEDNVNNGSKFNFWTTETSSDAPYIVATASTPLKYIVRHRRVYEAGDVVEIPNANGNRVFAVTVNYIGWNEEAPELDVVVPEVKRISYSDLVPKITTGENANVESGMWNGLAIYTTTKYQLSKEFADITEPTEITLTTDKIAKGYGIIVVAPLNETDNKNVIVNPDGSDLEWEDYEGVVIDYNYTNEGNEDFDPANATFVQRNSTAATFTGGTAYVYNAMNNSDNMYITGSALATTRNPYAGELHWTDLPDEYLGCNYIVVPFDGGFDGGVKEFTFTVNQPVKVYVHSSASAMTVADNISNDVWTASQYAVTRRFQNVLDHLSCAYMLKKGYINQTNIVLDGKIGSSNGVRFNRYDVYENLKADCGSYVGWVIDPEKVEATGFTKSINEYRYEEYLEAWVD